MDSSNIRRLARRAGYGAAGIVVGLPTLSAAYTAYIYGTTPKDQISTFHTPYSIWVQSLTNLFMTRLGSVSASNLEKACANAAEVNEQLLLSLVAANKDTAYGRDFGFGGGSEIDGKASIQSRDEFVRRHPITDHEHYRSYIDRVSNGESNVMFPGEPRMIAETSGTSGTRKLLPVNPLQRKVFFMEGIGTTFDALIKGVAKKTGGKVQWPNLQKSAKLMFRPRYGTSPGGLRVGPNSSSPDDNKTLLQLYTTPEEAWQVQSEDEMLFLHCLYALLDKNLGFIESNFASGVFNMFVCIDDRWDTLVRCIRDGKLPHDLNIDQKLRQKLEGGLDPNPVRADELESTRAKCRSANDSQGDGPSFARMVWPTLHTILAVETGSFAIYGEKLREEWIGDDITIYSPLYAASEGLIGVNSDIDAKTYILHPKSMFYEFIPIEDNEANSREEEDDETKTAFIEQLDVGKTYEMIITNLTGLYRYRFGDVVRCVGHRGEAPIVEFAYRKGQFLNALGERTSEEAFYRALSKAASDDWNLRLKDYTCVEYFNRPTGKRRPKYTVYVEVTNEDGSSFDRPMKKEEVDVLDQRLAEANQVYELFRKKNRLHCVEVIPVKSGTFERVRRAMVRSGVGITQIKQPRVTRRQDLVEILESGAEG